MFGRFGGLAAADPAGERVRDVRPPGENNGAVVDQVEALTELYGPVRRAHRVGGYPGASSPTARPSAHPFAACWKSFGRAPCFHRGGDPPSGRTSSAGMCR